MTPLPIISDGTRFLVLGVNHITAPVAVRERWALSPEESRERLAQLRVLCGDSEHVILSTCNRTEFYARITTSSIPDNSQEERYTLARLFYNDAREIRPEDIEPFYLYRERAAVEHLFRLASGLDSMIVGESEILRQIRDAYSTSIEEKTIGRLFHELFPAAIRVGKCVRSQTEIAKGCITPGQAALSLARERLGDLREQSVLLIGSGKIATMTATALAAEGITGFEVINRTTDRAHELAERIRATSEGSVEPPAVRISPWSELPEALARATLVVSSTGSPKPIIDAPLLEKARATGRSRPLMLVDLAIPRDVDPRAGSLPQVSVFNIDDLNRVIRDNVRSRHRHIPAAEEIIERHLHAFVGHMSYYVQVEPVIRHMFERFEEIRLGELQKTIDGFPEELHGELDRLTKSLVKKLLNFPISRLKSLRDGSGLSDAEVRFLKRLFPTDPS
ncbi:MAG TPA: glutamyl-tRNA reductase [Planctomycetota bacterium]|nr:glutamyl-tRNA reductase [Planctomycetota bacterium]